MKQKLLLTLLAMLLILPASAYDFAVPNDDGVMIYYNRSGKKATVTYKDTNYNSYSGVVNIPETVILPAHETVG